MSCFEGRIKELKNVSIDCFENNNIHSTTYFLSHCHSDHMGGLRSYIFLNRLGRTAHIYLYCSEITAHILTAEHTFAEVVDKIKVLPLGVQSIVLIPADDGSAEEVTVSLIPTGHCPGAVMFLFEGEMGRILYTGDFRICEGDVSRFRQLHYLDGTVKAIDKLYLDTTFLSHEYLRFPSRNDSTAILCDLITMWLQEGLENEVYIQTPGNYGSEAVFIAVAKRLKMKIHVKDEAYKVYKNVAEIREAVTNDPCCTRIHSCLPCKHWFQTDGKTAFLPCRGKSSRLQIIRPCAMTFKNELYDGSLESAVLRSKSQELIRICYSCHCSYRELEHFVKYLKPKQIEACVVPRNMKETDILQLLRDVSSWGNDSTDGPILTVSNRKTNEQRMSTDTVTLHNTALTGQLNTTLSNRERVVEEASGGNMQKGAAHADAEIYRLIAEDLRPKTGDTDVEIRRNISMTFLKKNSKF